MLASSKRRSTFGALFSIFLLVTGAYSADEGDCTVHDNGKYYNLTPLRAKKDYEIKIPGSPTLFLNVCQNVRTEMFGLRDGLDAGDVGGFIRRGHNDFSIGKVNTSLTVKDSRPRMLLSEGSKCRARAGDSPSDIRASTLIEFVCDNAMIGPGFPRVVAQLPPGDDESACAVVIEWRTTYACPTSEGGFWSFIGTTAVVFLVLLLAYTILGTLYNRFVLDLRGYDQIPQFSIESMKYHGREAWEWTRDMAGIIILNLNNRNSNGGSSGGYSGLASAGPRTPNPVSHQAQVSGFNASNGPASSDIEGGFGNANGGGSFIRSQTGRDRSAAFQRHEVNPVSHQSQVTQSLSFSASPPPVPRPTQSLSHQQQEPRQIPQTRTFGSEAQNSTRGEREFMLGDDEDGEELVDVAPPPLPEKSQPANPPQQQPATPGSGNAAVAAAQDADRATIARGRNTGEGAILL